MMKLNRLALALSVIVSSGLYSACSFDDSSYSGDTQPTPTEVTPIANSYQVVVKDAATGDLVADSVTLTFGGDAALVAADGTSLNGKSVTVTGGLYALGATFTSSATSFTVAVAGASGSGWVSSGSTVSGVAGQTGVSAVELQLVNTKQAAATNASDTAVAMSVATGAADASGALTTTVVASTPAKVVTLDDGSTVVMPSADVTLAVGTVAKTASGALAAAGPLTVAAVAYSTSTADALAVFPKGGTAAVSAADAAAVLGGLDAENVAFVPVGFADFSVTDSAGNAITSFAPPLSVAIDLPKTSLNSSGGTFSVGDTIPIWSFNQSTGAWTYEKTGTVAEKSPVDADNFTVAFTTSHLSKWTVAELQQSCSVSVTLPAGHTVPMAIQLARADGVSFSDLVATSDANDTSVSFSDVGKAAGFVIATSNGEEVGRKSVDDFCAGSVTFAATDLKTPAQAALGNLVVNVTQSCAGVTPVVQTAVSASVNVDAALFAYANAASGGNGGSVTFSNVLAGSHTVNVQNPKTQKYESVTASVTSGATATVNKNFSVTCATGS